MTHGAHRYCPAWTVENLERLASPLRDLDARLKIGEGSIETLEVALDGKTIANMEIGTWRTLAGDIDVLLGIPRSSHVESTRYDELSAHASILDIAGTGVAVASLDPVRVPLPGSQCGVGNGRTIAWTAYDDEFSSRDRSLAVAKQPAEGRRARCRA